jgi:cyclophilin family peptidyl-prolyl cis-trans isomerase
MRQKRVTKMRRLLRGIFAAFILVAGSSAYARVSVKSPVMELRLEQGTVTIALRVDAAPVTIEHIRRLANRLFYDGLSIVRIEPGHVVQGGDPNFDGTGGSGATIPLEVSDLHHTRGAVGMARSDDPHSGDSQFYICLTDRPQLDGRFTVIGYVSAGMEIIDRLALTPGDGPRGFITERASQPRIVSIRIRD